MSWIWYSLIMGDGLIITPSGDEPWISLDVLTPIKIIDTFTI